MVTKDELVSIGAEKLAETILSLSENRPDIQKQLEIIFAGFDSDPKTFISMIEKEITSLKECDRVVDFNEYHHLIYQVDQLRIHITRDVLPKFPHQAIQLLINFLDIHQNTLNRVDDINGKVGGIFQQACSDLAEAYKYTKYSLDDVVDLVYNRFVNNDYGVYDNIISHFKYVLADNGLSLLQQKLSETSLNKKNDKRVKRALEYIADCQNDMNAYLMACSVNGEPNASDPLEVAKRLIKHCRGNDAIKCLECPDIPFIESCSDPSLIDDWMQEKQALKEEAHYSCGDDKAAQAEILNWFETTLSHKAYREILKDSEVDSKESFQEIAIQKALNFPNPNTALSFLREIQEFEAAAKLVRLKIDTLDCSNYSTLRPIADVLCKIDPLAATLLYRKMIQRILIGAEFTHYNDAANDLATCLSLSSKISDWQEFQSHEYYFQEVSRKHKGKSKTWFWSQYKSINKSRKM